MKPLIIIAGPTAVGKSALSIEIAKLINGSIISADSMQVYKGMDIGTAKITSNEMDGIPHYLIDILDPSEDFNVVRFKELAKKALEEIYDLGRIPMIVGGTGFYIQSVLYDINFDETDEDDGTRQKLWDLLEERGASYVHKLLEDSDPEAAAKISENDHKRMIRALEYYMQTGERISDHNAECAKMTSPYDFCYFFLEDEREKIYDRINKRVDAMISAGLVDEVKTLTDKGLGPDNISMLGLGYKEITEYLSGMCSLDEAVYKIKRDSRHFAKRQITWSKRERDVIRINISKNPDPLTVILEKLEKKGIINERNA